MLFHGVDDSDSEDDEFEGDDELGDDDDDGLQAYLLNAL